MINIKDRNPSQAEAYFKGKCRQNLSRLSRKRVGIKTLEKVRETQREMRETIYRSICLINEQQDSEAIRYLKEYYEHHNSLSQAGFNAFVAACDLKVLQQYYFDIYEDPFEHDQSLVG